MMARRAELSSTWAALVALTLVVACGSDPAAKQGEVMVVISTDLAVPSDLDAIDWSVTLAGASTPFQSGTLELTSNLDLPETLSIAAGSHTTEPVTVQLIGRKGEGASAQERVSRSARVMAREGVVSRLDMPLEWLCSDANLGSPCPEGQTCAAGRCVDTPVSDGAELPAYATAPTPSCLDVPACFGAFRPKPPGRDPTTGACTVTGTSTLGADAKVNVALAVDTKSVGAYGFCGVEGECLIPLHRGAEVGAWQSATETQSPAVILPDAVCDDLSQSVKYVVAADLTTTCPETALERPFCGSPPSGCQPAPICPDSWPADAWQGFACTGGETPADSHPEFIDCWLPDLTPDSVPATANGRWCCTRGEPPAKDPLVIDDMSGGPVLKVKPLDGEVAGWWYTSLGEGSGDIHPPVQPALYTYREFSPPEQPAGGPAISRAACVKSSGFLSYVAMEGFFFSKPTTMYQASAYDLSPYSGISFWARSWDPLDAPLSVNVEIANVQTDTEVASECWVDGTNDRCGNFYATVELTSEWQQVSVRWDELRQPREDWDPPLVRFDHFDPHAYDIDFLVQGASDTEMSQRFDFCVADVSFTRD
jgi:hypothetical protein